ncbi:MAG: hypothetical protein P8L82_06145 [Paracoccaceae bacterium]|nr:hypothetical protein [Paracoccaceae bacterium]
MTAIKKYRILESKGLWIDKKETSPKEVIVSFGKSSIIISDDDAIPLDHWNFNSIMVTHKNLTRTTFGLGLDREEELIIHDEEMIEAITMICEQGKKLKEPVLKFNHLVKSLALLLTILFIFSVPTILRLITLDIIKPRYETIFVRSLLEKENLVENICTKQNETEELENEIVREFALKTRIDISITKSSLLSPLILPGGLIVIPFNWFKQKESHKKFEKLLKLSLKSFEERLVFIRFLKEQKLYTLLTYILGFEANFDLTLENYYAPDDPKIFGTENVLNISDEQWINITNSCLN